MKTLVLALVSLLASTSSHAAESLSGTCNFVNALGMAQLTITEKGGAITGPNGTAPVRSVRTFENYGALQMVEIDYTSLIMTSVGSRENVRVVMAIVSSPGTALMGVNYQGVVMLPAGIPALSFPGPFSYSTGGWLNPLGGMIPVMVPMGYVAIAAAYCNLR